MGVISIEQTDRLIWLGRYAERVYTTLRLFFEKFDEMIDQEDNFYQQICREIDIPDIYGNKEVFLNRYLYDETDPNSIYTNLLRAYDNAIVLREEIGSETLSYIQLAVYEMQKVSQGDAPLVELQKVIDYIMAFWGMADDCISQEQIRNMIKFGKRIERLDLYARFGIEKDALSTEMTRLSHRIASTGLTYHEDIFQALINEVKKADSNYFTIIQYVENIA